MLLGTLGSESTWRHIKRSLPYIVKLVQRIYISNQDQINKSTQSDSPTTRATAVSVFTTYTRQRERDLTFRWVTYIIAFSLKPENMIRRAWFWKAQWNQEPMFVKRHYKCAWNTRSCHVSYNLFIQNAFQAPEDHEFIAKIIILQKHTYSWAADHNTGDSLPCILVERSRGFII